MADNTETTIVLTKLELDTSQAVKASADLEQQNEETAKSTEDATEATEDYTGALDAMLGSLGILPASMQKGLSGTVKLTKGFTGLKAAIIATGIGALIIALGALFTWFNRTSEGQEKLAKGMAIMGQVVDVLLDGFAALGEGIFKAFDDPKAAITGLWDSIKTNLLNRLTGIVDLFGALGKGIKAALTFDWDETKKQLAEVSTALIQVTTGLDAEQQQAAIDGIANKWKEVSDSVREAGNLQERRNQLDRDEIAFLTTAAQLRTDISEQRLMANDIAIGINAQLEASNEAIRLTKQLYGEQIEQEKERVAILEEQQALGNNTIADNRELQQLKAGLILLDKEQLDQIRALQKNNNTLAKQAEAEAEKEKQRLLDIQILIDERDDAAAVKLEEFRLKQQENDALELEDFQEKQTELLRIELERYNMLVAGKELTDNEKLLLDEQYQAKVTDINRNASVERIAIEKAEAEAKQDIEIEYLQAINGLLLSFQTDLKALSVTQVLLASAVSLIAVWKQGNPLLAAIGTATVLLTTAKSLSDIAKAEKGMMLRGNSHSNGGILIEAEGGEAIVNKRTMSDPYLRSIVSAANVAGGGIPLAQNGLLVSQNATTSAIGALGRDLQSAIGQAQPVLVLEDFHSENNRVAVKEEISTF